MPMKPFSDPQIGVSGLKPGGWKTVDVGLWMHDPEQQVFLFQRGIPNMTAEQMRVGLIPIYGFPKPQERIAREQTEALRWDLYQVETGKTPEEALRLDVALAQAGKWAFIVLLACPPALFEQLHEQVFLPALKALKPVYTGAEAARIAKERAGQYTASVNTLREFMKSRLTDATDWVSDQMKGLEMPAPQKAPQSESELIVLPPPDKAVLKKANLLDCIADRKSRRKFTEADLTLDELSYLLWATQGVRQTLPTGRHYRTVPSAGSRHAFETYLVIQHVEGVKTGVYRYLPFDHQLVFLFTAADLAKTVTELASGQVFVGNSAVCFIWSAIPYRMEWRYGFGSERVILMDVGHVCQNLYLAAESLGCGTCAVAAYEQDKLDQFLGLDGKDEFAIYLAPVGKIGTAPEA